MLVLAPGARCRNALRRLHRHQASQLAFCFQPVIDVVTVHGAFLFEDLVGARGDLFMGDVRLYGWLDSGSSDQPRARRPARL